MSRSYLQSLSRYQRVLEQRNSLLRQLSREPSVNVATAIGRLEFWDQELIAHGSPNEVRAALNTAIAWGWLDDPKEALEKLDRLLALLWRLTNPRQ